MYTITSIQLLIFIYDLIISWVRRHKSKISLISCYGPKSFIFFFCIKELDDAGENFEGHTALQVKLTGSRLMHWKNTLVEFLPFCTSESPLKTWLL